MGPKMRMTTVDSVVDLSPHIKRIVLTGNSLSDFPHDKKSAHVKVIFPKPGALDKMPKLGLYFGFKKYMRSYTVRAFDTQKLQLTIDFTVNDHQGLASHWAAHAKPGDHLGIAGPGDTKHPNLLAENHLFFGDITALPAIASSLELLPKDAKGQAWIQVPDKQDIQQLIMPTHMQVNWLVTSDKLTNKFLTALTEQPTNLNNTAIFIAAEASIVKQLKLYLNKHCDYKKSNLYASAYWNKKR